MTESRDSKSHIVSGTSYIRGGEDRNYGSHDVRGNLPCVRDFHGVRPDRNISLGDLQNSPNDLEICTSRCDVYVSSTCHCGTSVTFPLN